MATTKNSEKTTSKLSPKSGDLAPRLFSRIQALAMNMIYVANHRDDSQKGDPKVGGHPSACSSALHLLSTLHLFSKNAQDYIACKPHASPTDHANNYLLRLFVESDGTRMNDDRARLAMKNLRRLPPNNEPFFQSYHSSFDPDHFNYLPSGSVGIPPVQAVYLAHAYRMAMTHDLKVPEDAQFWCLMGDSEYREGSLMEVLPEVSERGLGNVTWILDYNRQSLDGHRILNEEAMGGKDNDRVEKTALANGWDVLQLRHGRFRKQIFESKPEGEALQSVLENALPDYEFQSLLAKRDAKATVEAIGRYDKGASGVLGALSEADVNRFMLDLGGHDYQVLQEAYEESRRDQEKPMLLVAHTIKGWNLRCAAQSTNHSAMLNEEEVFELLQKSGANVKDLYAFERFDENSEEGKFLAARSDLLWKQRQHCLDLRKLNTDLVRKEMASLGVEKDFPKEVGINLKMVPLAHTQWMFGQMTAKLARVADTPLDESEVKAPFKPLSPEEKKLKPFGTMLFTMAPDVGTSTNLNSNMDGRIFGPDHEDFEAEYGVKDSKAPDIVPHENKRSRYVRFDIVEGNSMSCAASYGKMADLTGIPFLPVMSVYDFFIKRALDQLFYGAYWNSSFIVVGTPSGVSLSPEGAQHAWKSDIQIANLITWEPAYSQELDWIFTESARRHLNTAIEGKDSPNGNAGRSAVIIRLVTRALEQKEFLARLKKQKRFEGLPDDQILESTRKDCLAGGYYLIDFRGHPQYNPSENVVHIFTMGTLVTEALTASDALLKEGIFANVIQVSSPDLLLGNLAYKNGYAHLREGLGIRGDLYLSRAKAKAASNGAAGAHYPPAQFGPTPRPIGTGTLGMTQLLSLGGRRIPIVSVHDGEPGLLDNLGSVVGTLQRTLAVRKHSKSGTPRSIYAYHEIDSAAVVKAAQEVLEDSAYTPVQIDKSLLDAIAPALHEPPPIL